MINTDITLKQWWLMSNEKVEKCQNCSKRSRCMECRAIEIKMTGDIKGKRQCEYFQNYDLEEGK